MMETNFAVSLAEQQVKGEVDRNRLEIDDDDYYHTPLASLSIRQQLTEVF